uniref:SP-RING-type domain-containing protein n=1 Tax=Timspurckia oligopyrenoides TaxID=708627 RepID=A0A7S1ER15_9RHOD|mmetsp:Transcript_1726/g.3054  ORF Transcript_1726/g.3054 Transcript_1726/m.3054 type:complete len:738 (+) Transcript_1726:2154-4367(+)
MTHLRDLKEESSGNSEDCKGFSIVVLHERQTTFMDSQQIEADFLHIDEKNSDEMATVESPQSQSARLSQFDALVKLSEALTCSNHEALKFLQVLEQLDSSVIGIFYSQFGPKQQNKLLRNASTAWKPWLWKSTDAFHGASQEQMIDFLKNLANYTPCSQQCNILSTRDNNPWIPELNLAQLTQLEWFFGVSIRGTKDHKKRRVCQLWNASKTESDSPERVLDCVLKSRARSVSVLPPTYFHGVPFKNALERVSLSSLQNGATSFNERQRPRSTRHQIRTKEATYSSDSATKVHILNDSTRNDRLKSALTNALMPLACTPPRINIDSLLENNELLDVRLLQDVPPKVIDFCELVTTSKCLLRHSFMSPGDDSQVMLGCMQLLPEKSKNVTDFTSDCFQVCFPFASVSINESMKLVNKNALNARNQNKSLKNAHWFDITKFLYPNQTKVNVVELIGSASMSKAPRSCFSNDIFVVFLCKSKTKCTESIKTRLIAECETNVKLIMDNITERNSTSALEAEREFVKHICSKGEVSMDSLKLDLKCPLSYSRITIPVRGKRCKHIQCFDLVSLMKLRLKFNACPVCGKKKSVDVKDLVYSPLIQSILDKHPDAMDVYIFPNGESYENQSCKESVALESYVVEESFDDEFVLNNNRKCIGNTEIIDLTRVDLSSNEIIDLTGADLSRHDIIDLTLGEDKVRVFVVEDFVRDKIEDLREDENEIELEVQSYKGTHSLKRQRMSR